MGCCQTAIIPSNIVPRPIYEFLGDDDKETYTKIKKAILDRLNPHRLATQEELSLQQLHEEVESIDELARDLEKLLGQNLTRASSSYWQSTAA